MSGSLGVKYVNIICQNVQRQLTSTSDLKVGAAAENHYSIVVPICPPQLYGVRVLVLLPSSSVLSSSEENAIVDHLRNGGGLLLLDENSYDGHTSLVSDVSVFGR